MIYIQYKCGMALQVGGTDDINKCGEFLTEYGELGEGGVV